MSGFEYINFENLPRFSVVEEMGVELDTSFLFGKLLQIVRLGGRGGNVAGGVHQTRTP